MRERIGLLLIVLGGLASIAGGLHYLGIPLTRSLADPGVLLAVIGIGCLGLGAFFLTRADGTRRSG